MHQYCRKGTLGLRASCLLHHTPQWYTFEKWIQSFLWHLIMICSTRFEVHMYYVLIVRYLIHPNLFVVFQYVRYGNWIGVFLTLAYRVFFSNFSCYLPKSSGGGLFCIICLICIFIVTWLTTAVTWPLKRSKR